MTEVWFRNPHNYIRELVEAGGNRIAWDMGILVKNGIDPTAHAKLYFHQAPWRALLVGDQGTVEIGPDNPVGSPIGVYPTWVYGEKIELLEEMIAMPAGDDPRCYNDMSVPVQERPVKGQPHRVVITELPRVSDGAGRQIIRKLVELQEEYPDVILHLHGLYSYRVAFGMGFKSADIDARTKAAKGNVVLPNGREMIAEKTIGCPQWVAVLGMRVVELKIPRNRCIYNVKSALWAADHWDENLNFKSVPSKKDVDYEAIEANVLTTRSHLSVPVQPKPGDRIACDSCSLQDKCKYYREGAVCSVPGSESSRLAEMFKSRDSGRIIDALGILMERNTKRLESGIQEEESFGELSPEVTKIGNQLFNQGVQLAKLVDPNLRGGPKVQVNVNGGTAQIGAGAPQNSIMASIVRDLEAQGVQRHEITTEMIQGVLSQMAAGTQPPKAIEGQVLGTRDD